MTIIGIKVFVKSLQFMRLSHKDCFEEVSVYMKEVCRAQFSRASVNL